MKVEIRTGIAGVFLTKRFPFTRDVKVHCSLFPEAVRWVK